MHTAGGFRRQGLNCCLRERYSCQQTHNLLHVFFFHFRMFDCLLNGTMAVVCSVSSLSVFFGTVYTAHWLFLLANFDSRRRHRTALDFTSYKNPGGLLSPTHDASPRHPHPLWRQPHLRVASSLIGDVKPLSQAPSPKFHQLSLTSSSCHRSSHEETQASRFLSTFIDLMQGALNAADHLHWPNSASKV